MNFDLVQHTFIHQETSQTEGQAQQLLPSPTPATPLQKEFRRYMKSTVLGVPLDCLNEDGELKSILSFGSSNDDGDEHHPIPLDSPYCHDLLTTPLNLDSARLTPLASDRKIPTAPFKSLQLCGFLDDFYVNLMSWSQDGVLAVAIVAAVYLYDYNTSRVRCLTTVEGNGNYVTSLSWCTTPGQCHYLAVGTFASAIELWDAQSSRRVRVLPAMAGRVTSLAWNNSHWLSSGGSDSMILQHDLRVADRFASIYVGHSSLVCGLAWNADSTKLASGSKDETVCIWDAAMSSRRHRNGQPRLRMGPQHVLSGHKSTVKALAWCPLRESVLATGGGVDDKAIKLWNTQNGSILDSVDTGAQVTSLLWSKHYPELLSSHGYTGNQLILWKYPKMTKMRTWHKHEGRILHMAMSPDGRTVATAGADEMLNFWQMFGASETTSKKVPMLRPDFILPGTPTVR
jgi:cell division cycle protein 20 (cofactor of APC complex)